MNQKLLVKRLNTQLNQVNRILFQMQKTNAREGDLGRKAQRKVKSTVGDLHISKPRGPRKPKIEVI